MITKEAIRSKLGEFSARDADSILAAVEDGVAIEAEKTEMGMLALGASRFGGVPDLPAGFVWPTRGRRCLAFLAQIDLAAARAPGLPTRGSLVFFYDEVEQPWGFDPEHAGGWAVRFISDDAPLARADAGPRSERRAPFEPSALHFALRPFLPAPSDVLVQPLLAARANDLYGVYDSVVDSTRQEGPNHRLRGHPWLVQGDLRCECQLAANGLFAGDPDAYQMPKARELLPHAAETWTLLLQVDTDESGPGWMWGDVGSLYFMIRREDLAARRFDRVWLVLQCC